MAQEPHYIHVLVFLSFFHSVLYFKVSHMHMISFLLRMNLEMIRTRRYSSYNHRKAIPLNSHTHTHSESTHHIPGDTALKETHGREHYWFLKTQGGCEGS